MSSSNNNKKDRPLRRSSSNGGLLWQRVSDWRRVSSTNSLRDTSMMSSGGYSEGEGGYHNSNNNTSSCINNSDEESSSTSGSGSENSSSNRTRQSLVSTSLRSVSSRTNLQLSTSMAQLLGLHNNNNNNNHHHQGEPCSGSVRSSSRRVRKKPSPTMLYLRHRASAGNVSVMCMGVLLVILACHRILSLYMSHRRWLNAPITYLERACPVPEYERLSLSSSVLSASENNNKQDTTTIKEGVGPAICMVTFTDANTPSLLQRLVRWRDYAGILELTWPNKQAYAQKHNYRLYDHSDYLDTSRPPAWSKIPATLALLQPQQHLHANNNEPPCDWVLWTDADTVIMNSSIKITDFLPASPTHDLIVASDEGGGFNSGVFLFRNSDWSRQFLQQWWDMTTYVRPPGFSLSGDNAAMKALLKDLPDFDKHVLVPPRCTINSFARFLTVPESKHVMDTLEDQEWYMSDRFYHKTDFIAHTPGYDNKAECIRLLLQEAE